MCTACSVSAQVRHRLNMKWVLSSVGGQLLMFSYISYRNTASCAWMDQSCFRSVVLGLST